jgi:hypothetical protein
MSNPYRRLERPAARLGVALMLAVCLGSAAWGESSVQVTIESPGAGVQLEGAVHQAEIEGQALAAGDAPERFDVMLAIDVSHSTKAASGSDIDRDGQIGVNPRFELLPPDAYPRDMLSTDPGDSILHAQVMAAHALIQSLDARRVRVGLLSFSGEVDPVSGQRKRIDQQDARLEAPLTDDFEQLHRILNAVLVRGAHGATNFAAGVRLAIVELSGLSGARSQPRPGAKKVVLFLTDGMPTLPVGKGSTVDPGDKEAALRAAQVAHTAGVVINTYALGPVALKYPETLTEMSRVSLGSYTPVQNPGDIVALLQGVSFANVEDVVFTNLSTGDFSTDVRLSPDGTFDGFVPVREGRNRVRVSALASDGSRGAVEFEFDFSHAQVGEREQMAELERIRRQNKDLELRRMELDINAFRAEQRKRVEIEVERREPDAAGSESAGGPEDGSERQ